MKKTIIASLITLATASSMSAHAENLLDVYRLAKQNDPGLRSAAATYNSQKEEVTITKGNLFPDIAFDADLGYTDTDADYGDSDNNTNSLKVSLDYPIYSPALGYAVDAVEINYESSGVDYDNTEEDLSFESISAYFDLLTQMSNLNTAKSQAKATASQLDQVKKQYEVGQVAITDLHTAQAEYDSNIVDIISAEADMINAQETLRQLTGKLITDVPDLSKDYPIIMPIGKTATNYVDLAKRQNKDIKSLMLANEYAQTNIEIQKSNGRVPTVTVSGSLTRSDSDTSPTASSDGEALAAYIGVNVSIPLYQGGAIDATVKQSVYDAVAAEENLEDGIQTTELAVRSLYRDLKTSVAQIAAQKQLIISNTSSLEATQAGYDVGTRNIVELLDAQSDLYDSQGTLEQLRYSFAVKQMSLLEYTGELTEEKISELNSWLTY
ncbi:outer membrane protein TolC [Marinomonas sp. MED121]|uniref:TolC family outer membrane protein n=1 Tax=Marinomonas sp. MED121 TaxID=314277 RepID=UPI000068FFB4|nr:TolC family outer membrane protein [Marinomonas sp. MED121]EAQ67008.1 outer membrane protein TolC [Marinomonas sp. MED121]